MDKTSKFCFDKRILLVVFFLSIVAGSLYIASLVGKTKTSTNSRASEIDSSQVTTTNDTTDILDPVKSKSLADNELKFIKSIYKLYISDTSKDFRGLYDNAYNYSSPAMSNFYRSLCTQATMTAIVEGDNLKDTTPYVQYFISKYSSAEMRSIKRGVSGSAPFFDCLLAANVLRDVLPKDKVMLNTMLDDISTYIKSLVADTNANGGSPGYYEKISVLNYGDSQAEESLGVASLLHLASQLLPVAVPGAVPAPGFITPQEQADYLDKSIALAKWGYSKCAKAGNCSIKSDTGLVVNHMMDPHIIYTLSLLTGYSEIALTYNQLGKPLPTALFDSNLKNALNTLSTNLQKYLASNFSLKGNFNIVKNTGEPATVVDYTTMKYTIDDNATYPINSSIPIDRVDTMSQLVSKDNRTLISYTYKDGKAWHFRCDLMRGGCTAIWQKSNTQYLNSIKRKPDNSDKWSEYPIPVNVDAFSQYYLPYKTVLKRYLISGKKMWHYLCPNFPTDTACEAQYVILLSDAWKNLKWSQTPPDDKIDAFSQYVIPNTRTLRSFIYKGDRVWAYTCTDVDTAKSKCKADYTTEINKEFKKIVGNTIPVSNLDAVFQYYSADNKVLKSYVIQGDTLWAYICTPGACSQSYAKKLTDSFTDISYQNIWNKSSTPGVVQYSGVSDWSFDATVQNSAFSSLYIADPIANYDLYSRLQAEQLTRKRDIQAYYPTNYTAGVWNNAPFLGTKKAEYAKQLTDGWREINQSTGLNYLSKDWQPATQDERINVHWWFNILAAKNHSVAYLLLTDKKLLKQFAQGDL